MWHAIQGIYRKIYFRFKTQNAYETPDDFTKNLVETSTNGISAYKREWSIVGKEGE